MNVLRGENILLEDIYVNSISSVSGITARNTDGLDTIFSNNIHINRWYDICSLFSL